MVARLKPGITPVQAQQDAQVVAQAIMRNLPGEMQTLRIRAAVQRLDEATVETSRPLVRALFLAVAVVLFIACANLAGLLLVRVIRRRREISVRLALGASSSAVLRQNLVETLALSVSGGLLGLALASVALRVGVSFLPENLPRIGSISLDWKVVGFAFVLAIVTGFVCGIAPALAATRTDVNEALKEGGRTGTSGGGHARLRSVLVVVELAVALVLLTGAGLLLRSFEKLRAVDMGFRTDHMSDRILQSSPPAVLDAGRGGRIQPRAAGETATIAERAGRGNDFEPARSGQRQQQRVRRRRFYPAQRRRTADWDGLRRLWATILQAAGIPHPSRTRLHRGGPRRFAHGGDRESHAR